MSDPAREEAARRRWLAISLARWGGVGFVLLGLLVHNGVIRAPEELAYGLLGLGLAGTFIMPRVLARRWRTPPE